MKIEIKHRWTAAVLYTTEVDDSDERPIRTALTRAIAADANLADANLADANLARANLADANLADANLAGANLAGAYLARVNLAGAYLARVNLAGAYLADAYLADANLADANLAGANLAGAYLARVNLADAYLADANLADANLADANLADAYLAGANLADANLADAKNVPDGTAASSPPEPYVRPTTPVARAQRLAEHAKHFRERNPHVPVVEKLDAKILEVVDAGRGVLRMASWHGSEREDGTACGTTHCRAGWAIMLAGEAGKALEKEYGPERAGVMIYRASTGRVPNFFASDDRALEDIKRCAAEQTEATQG